jgi:hypothetical protein
MTDREGRISKLSERFKPHTGRPKQSTKERERRSFYLDVGVMTRLDDELKAFNHRNYPTTVSKSVFLETLLEYGLEHLDAIQERIANNHPSESNEPE